MRGDCWSSRRRPRNRPAGREIYHLAGLGACFLLLRLALDAGTFIEPALGISSAVAQLFFPAQQAGLANDFPNQRGTALAWNNSALFLGSRWAP